MAVFAPYRPDTLDNPIVYVINFYELTENYEWIPKNMTFDVNGIGIPNSYVQQMPLKEAQQLIENTKNDIANMIFTTATDLTLENGLTMRVWPPDSEPASMGGTTQYSFEVTDTFEIVKREIFFGVFKTKIPMIVKSPRLETLFSTYCINQIIDGYDNFYRCDRCLDFEKDHLIPHYQLNNFVVDFFPFSTDAVGIVPNCDKCNKKNKWIVYCSYTINNETIQSNTYIEKTDHEQLVQNKFGTKYKNKDVCARFFRSEAAAKSFYNSLVDTKPWNYGRERSIAYVKYNGECQPIDSLCACMFGSTFRDMESCANSEQYAVYCFNGKLKVKQYFPPDPEIENTRHKFFKTEDEAIESVNKLTGPDWGIKWACSISGGGCYEADEFCCGVEGIDMDTCYDDPQTCEENCGSGSGSETESQSFLFDPKTNTWKLK